MIQLNYNKRTFIAAIIINSSSVFNTHDDFDHQTRRKFLLCGSGNDLVWSNKTILYSEVNS